MSSTVCVHIDRYNHSTIYNFHILCGRYTHSYSLTDPIISHLDDEISVCYAFAGYWNGYDSTTLQKQRSNVQKLDEIDVPVRGLCTAVRWIWFFDCIAICVRHIFVDIIFVFCIRTVFVRDHVMLQTIAGYTAVVNDGIYYNNLHDDISGNVCVCDQLQFECLVCHIQRYQKNFEEWKVFNCFVIVMITQNIV